MAFNFGAAAPTASGAPGASGFSLGAFTPKTTATTGFGFGTATTTAASTFGGGFGGFGATTAAPSGSAFSFSTPASTGTTGMFGATQNKSFGLGTGFGGAGTSTGLGTTLAGGLQFGGFNTQPQQQQQQQQTALGSLFSQLAGNPAQSNQLINTASALSAPTLLGDERDAILAKWNQLQAFWGTGKGYFNNNIPPVDFTQENPFCRFKAVGYSCIPSNKDEDGLLVLLFNKKEADIRSQQQQLVESLHRVLGGNQTLSVNVDGVKAMPDDQNKK